MYLLKRAYGSTDFRGGRLLDGMVCGGRIEHSAHSEKIGTSLDCGERDLLLLVSHMRAPCE